ncbi:MAG: hypothetical protein ACHQVS_04140, partial [Candidatus Babeliales bacterium]
KFTIKTFLTALTLMVSAFSIYCADLTPEELEQLEKAYAQEAVEKSLGSERKQTKEQEELEAALALSLSEQSKPTVVPAKPTPLSEEEQLALALSLSEAEEKERAALEAFAKKLKQEQEQKAAMAEKEHKHKAEQAYPITKFETISYEVHPQTGASCGLHSIDNGNKCYIALHAGKSMAELQQILKTGLSEGAQTVKKRDMLDKQEIDYVALHNLNMNEAIFSIINNITQSREEFLKPLPQITDITELPHNLGTAIEALRTHARATHIFVIGDMKISRNEKGELVGQNDHWIAIVADKKDGIVTFHYMCTGGGCHAGIVKVLQDIIEHGNYYGMQLSTLLEEYSLRTIKRLLKDGNYTMLLVLERQIDLARKAGVINDARFPKQEIIEILESVKVEPYQKQAQELLKKLS